MSQNKQIKYSEISYSTTEDDGSVFTEVNGVKTNIRPGELVQECGTFEANAAKVSKYKNFTTVVPIWLETKEKLDPKEVLDALWIVSRQVPHLQLCLSKRRCKLWLKRVTKLEIDFEITTSNVMNVMEEMFDTTFDLWNGPLWKVRLIVNKEKTENDKFSYIFVYVTLHTINDGVTNMKVAREFVTNLNRHSSGKEVTPTFSPVVPPIDEVVKPEIPLIYLYERGLKTFYNRVIRNFHHVTSFSGSLPFPKTTEAKTKVLIDDLSQSESSLLAAMCKREKVSINTFIITVANFALMAVAQSRSESPLGERKIVIAQNVNVRRHYEPQYSDATGYHVSLLEDTLKMSLLDADNFWTLATNNQLRLKESLEVEKGHINVLPIYPLARVLYPVNNFLTRKGYRNRTLVHYVTSNMGNLKNFLPELNEGDNVQISYLIRACSLQHTGSLFMLNFQTLNGKMIISMDYYTNQMKREIAQEFFSTLFQFIRNMINSHQLYGVQSEEK